MLWKIPHNQCGTIWGFGDLCISILFLYPSCFCAIAPDFTYISIFVYPSTPHASTTVFSSPSSTTGTGDSSTPRCSTASGRSSPSRLGFVRDTLLRLGVEEVGDVFNDLFYGSTAGVNGSKNMVLGARLALEKPPPLPNARIRSNTALRVANNEVWVELDSLGWLSGRVASNWKTAEEDNDWGLGEFGSRLPAVSLKIAETLWDLDEVPSAASLSPSAPTVTSGTTRPTT